MDYSKKSRTKLIEICKENGIKCYSGKNKNELVKIIISHNMDKGATDKGATIKVATTKKTKKQIKAKDANIEKMENTTLINIENYTSKFEAYPSDLVDFAKENNFELIPLTSMRGQALALMSQVEVRGKKHLGRDETVKFFTNIGMETTDAIQQFNKAFGLKRIKMRGNYCLKYPFECDLTDIDKRKGVSISGDKNTKINYIKSWWKKNLIDVPNEDWQIGHLDPTISDATEKNLAYQPPIQGKYRDRFKFDDIFHKMWPTAYELVPKINEFYTDKEQQVIYEFLKQKFEPR
jgi:hypothetical protein